MGCDAANPFSTEGWEFIRPYVEDVDAYVFSRAKFAPAWVDRQRLHVIPPSIDPFSAKNQPLDGDVVRGILQFVGLLGGRADPPTVPFTRRDGSPGESTGGSTSLRPAHRRRRTLPWCSRPLAGTA